MLNSFYLFLVPLLAVLLYICVKYIIHRKTINKMSQNAFLKEEANQNNLAE